MKEEGQRAKPMVLVIEDNATHRTLEELILRAQGYEVQTAGSGEQGLALARELKPGLIVLDILMYPVDGWKVMGELTESPDTRDIPVVVVTIVADGEPRARQMGVRGYLRKPFTVKQLADVVKAALPLEGRQN